MDHTQLIARLTKEVAGARASIAASYQRLWRSAATSAGDPDDAESSDPSSREPAISEERPPAEGEPG